MKDNDERYQAICRRIHRGEELLGQVQRFARGRLAYSRFNVTALVTDVREWARTLPTNPPSGHFRSGSQRDILERLRSFLDSQLAALDVARHKETHPR